MKELINLISNHNQKKYIYFKSLFSAKSFEIEAKEHGFTFINDGVCSIVEINENKTARFISYGEHEGIKDKIIL